MKASTPTLATSTIPASSTGAKATRPPQTGNETVLVVEDSPEVLELAIATVSDLGYRVLSASDGPSALDIIEKSKEKIDLLFSDVVMPSGMNGVELPVGNGGPLRIRLPRQLGYKSVKFVNRLIVTDDVKKFGKGLGSVSPEGGYAWYAGI